MVRRVGNLWPKIAGFENLLSAAGRAARGKRDRESVARFMMDRERNCLRLLDELEDGSFRPGPPRVFVIHDPKTRTISAAPFRDRVVHQALIGPLIPVFERRMIDRSYACRLGKGQHAALREAQRMLRRHGYFLKLDVRHCFESLDHDVVMATLERVLKDQRVLELCERIVRARPSPVLPIGNLTSQWFANLVLDRLDHFVTAELRLGNYLRYMDDFVIFHQDRDRLRVAHREVGAFLEQTLRLRLKDEATILAPAAAGLPYLGWNIHRGTMRLRPQNLRRIRRRLVRERRSMGADLIHEEELIAGRRATLAWLETGSTRALRRGWNDWLADDG